MAKLLAIFKKLTLTPINTDYLVLPFSTILEFRVYQNNFGIYDNA